MLGVMCGHAGAVRWDAGSSGTTVGEKRMREALELVDSLLGNVGMVDMRGVQRLAGLLA